LFDIFIDDLVAGLHDTCSEHGICMGQTDVASLLYADDANALSFTPMACKVDGLSTHWLNKWRMQGNFTKSKVMVFHPGGGESCSVPAQDRNAWTLGGIAIDQVSKYKYLGVVYQEDGSWQAHAQGARKDASSLWVPTAVMQQSADKGQTAHGSDLHLFRGHVWRGSVGRRRSKTRCQRS
jgi:hypothetical protein